MAENAVTLVGSLGQDPVLRSTGRGDFTTFSLAVNSRYRDASGNWVDGQTSWFDVSADGALGRNAASSLAKGQRVVVHGTVGTKDVSKQDGSKTRYVQVRASAIGLDLLFGTASFSRTTGPRPAEQPASASASVAEQPRQDAPGQQSPPERQGGDWGEQAPEQEVPQQQPVPAAQAVWGTGSFADDVDAPF